MDTASVIIITYELIERPRQDTARLQVYVKSVDGFFEASSSSICGQMSIV